MLFEPAPSAFKPIRIGIVIVCEDSNSGYEYLKQKADACANISPKVVKHSQEFTPAKTDAHSLAKNAIAEIGTLNANYVSDTEDPMPYKEVYCVVDVDDNILHNKLAPAYQEINNANASNPSIKHELIVSNENLEIWYILHFQDITFPLYRGIKAQTVNLLADGSNLILNVLENATDWERSQKKFKNFIKNFKHLFEYLKINGGSEANAIQRAKDLEKASGTTQPCQNPSTDMYKLIERLNSFK
jgi:RloB-like protein